MQQKGYSDTTVISIYIILSLRANISSIYLHYLIYIFALYILFLMQKIMHFALFLIHTKKEAKTKEIKSEKM